jgi:hypothetical protein
MVGYHSPYLSFSCRIDSVHYDDGGALKHRSAVARLRASTTLISKRGNRAKFRIDHSETKYAPNFSGLAAPQLEQGRQSLAFKPKWQ